jgi:hypothetical protein
MSLWSRQRKDGTLVYYYKFRWRKRTYQGYIGPVSKTTAKRVELQKEAEEAQVLLAAPPRLPATHHSRAADGAQEGCRSGFGASASISVPSASSTGGCGRSMAS